MRGTIIAIGVCVCLAIALTFVVGFVEDASRIKVVEGGSKLNVVKYTGSESDIYQPVLNSSSVCFRVKDGKNDGKNKVKIYKNKDKTISEDLDKVKDKGNKDVYCTGFSQFVQLGENTIIVVNQTEKSVVFEIENNRNISATLYKNISGDWNNTVDSVWVRFSQEKWKFGADDNNTDGNLTNYKYVLKSEAPLRHVEGKYYFLTSPMGGYHADFFDICSQDSANCSYSTGMDGNLSVLEVNFWNTGIIDPSYAFHALDTNSILTNLTFEPNNRTHLTISSNSPYNSLVAYYPFDADTGTTLLDFSGNNNDGTYLNRSFANKTEAGCVYGGCFYNNLDSLNENSYATASVQSTNLSTNVTVSMWVLRRETTGSLGERTFFSTESTGNNAMVFGRIDSATRSRFSYRDVAGNFNTVYAAGPFDTESWRHYAFTLNGTGASFYQNGILVNSTNYPEKPSGGLITKTYLGHIPALTNGRNWNGSLDDVMIFNSSLSDEQILAIFNNQSQRFRSSGLMQTPVNIIQSGNDRLNVTLRDYTRTAGSNLSVQVGTWNRTLGYNTTFSGLVLHLTGDKYSPAGESATHAVDLTGINNGTVSPDVVFVPGVFNNSFNFDTVSNVTVADDASYDVGNNITFGAWVKADSFVSGGMIIQKGSGTSSHALQYGGGSDQSKVRCFLRNNTAGNYDLIEPSGTTVGVWYHYMCNLNETNSLNIYRDGVLVNSTQFEGSINNVPANLFIGKRINGAQGINGSIDDVMWFNRSLSPEEVKALYLRGRANWQYSQFHNISGNASDTLSENVFNMTRRTTSVFANIRFTPSANSFYTPITNSFINLTWWNSTTPEITDVDAPVITVHSPANGLVTTAQNILFNISVNDESGISMMEYSVISRDMNVSFNGSAIYNVPPGSYNVQFCANDTLGNSGCTGIHAFSVILEGTASSSSGESSGSSSAQPIRLQSMNASANAEWIYGVADRVMVKVYDAEGKPLDNVAISIQPKTNGTFKNDTVLRFAPGTFVQYFTIEDTPDDMLRFEITAVDQTKVIRQDVVITLREEGATSRFFSKATSAFEQGITRGAAFVRVYLMELTFIFGVLAVMLVAYLITKK